MTKNSPANSWFKRKNYPHFDLPLSEKGAARLVSDVDRIAHHNFFPFLFYKSVARRINSEPKIRDIRYASHKDRYIYSFYAEKLSVLYESLLSKEKLEKQVLAYRPGNGCNIDAANEAFDRITELADCIALGFDIKNFFDNLNHLVIKSNWVKLLQLSNAQKIDKLPADHFAVYKSITAYSSVDRNDCYKRLHYSKQQIKKSRPICSASVFRDKIKSRNHRQISLVKTNLSKKGIPQGSSLSAVLSNLYMLDFDIKMKEFTVSIGGVYRRYCDDILVIVAPEYENAITHLISEQLKTLKLSINTAKTTRAVFFRIPTGVRLKQKDKPFQYLGFLFDGERRLLRSQTISRFWRNLRKYLKRAEAKERRAAQSNPQTRLFRRKLYSRFTTRGKRNFITYAMKAAKKMTQNGNWKKSPIWNQIKGHEQKILQLIE